MRTHHIALATAILLAGLGPLAAAVAQDDAGLGRDAPDDAESAAAIFLGDFRGTLDPSLDDLADWYFICNYVSGVLKLVIDTAGLEVRVGDVVAKTPVDLALDPCPGALGILATGSARVPYDLRLIEVPATDFAVTSLDVRTVGSGAAALASTTRQIDVTVQNQGGMADLVTLEVRLDTLAVSRLLYTETLLLEPGDTASRTVTWTLADPATRTTVRALAKPELDVFWGNNEMLRGVGLSPV